MNMIAEQKKSARNPQRHGQIFVFGLMILHFSLLRIYTEKFDTMSVHSDDKILVDI